jgi:hypothetical protein
VVCRQLCGNTKIHDVGEAGGSSAHLYACLVLIAACSCCRAGSKALAFFARSGCRAAGCGAADACPTASQIHWRGGTPEHPEKSISDVRVLQGRWRDPRFFEPLNLQVLIAFCCMQLRHTVTPGPSHLYPRPSDRFDRFSDHCHRPLWVRAPRRLVWQKRSRQ